MHGVFPEENCRICKSATRNNIISREVMITISLDKEQYHFRYKDHQRSNVWGCTSSVNIDLLSRCWSEISCISCSERKSAIAWISWSKTGTWNKRNGRLWRPGISLELPACASRNVSTILSGKLMIQLGNRAWCYGSRSGHVQYTMNKQDVQILRKWKQQGVHIENSRIHANTPAFKSNDGLKYVF